MYNRNKQPIIESLGLTVNQGPGMESDSVYSIMRDIEFIDPSNTDLDTLFRENASNAIGDAALKILRRRGLR